MAMTSSTKYVVITAFGYKPINKTNYNKIQEL